MSHVYEKLHISAVFRNLSDILIKKKKNYITFLNHFGFVNL